MTESNHRDALSQARTDVRQAINSLTAIKDMFKGDFSNAAISAKLEFGYVINDLERGDRRLAELQNAANRWIEDIEAGAIG